jgi:hypothetical protein
MMKAYVNPQINVELLNFADVITASDAIPTLQRGTFGSDAERTESFGDYFSR